MRNLSASLVAAAVLVLAAMGVVRAQAIGAGGGGITQSVTDALYCALTGCTMAGQVQDTVATLTPTDGGTLDGGASDVVALDFSKSTAGMKTTTLDTKTRFTASNIAAGTHAYVRIIGGGGSLVYSSFPSWVFVGSASPSSIAAGKTAVLAVDCYSTTEASCTAAYSVQP